MEEIKLQAVISGVRINPGGDSEFKMKVPATQVSEIVKLAEMGQLNVNLKFSASGDKKVLEVILSNLQVGEPINSDEETEPRD